MAYTSFGEFVRILRIQHHEVMGDMAKKLETSLSFLSAVENGKKNVPAGWLEKISSLYKLSKEEISVLKEYIEESKTQFKITATEAGSNQRKAALQFTRSFGNMDDETAMEILNLLSNKEKK
ncbi:MAG: helix-turn-helix transcriptional regulator [Anaerovibrio sp.]|uniref:helix-turn-helix domain-containing protein n=1 Tax=Anaerovibrio sp. TaxID=1872532 RepID=UPI0025BE7D02|nr:helix-turn-helix transcriptional regulator [Anaerovibrio sp.]MBE6099926.1 helix-turn-helix transcriptional regulator [Anaerovibrio sp.]